MEMKRNLPENSSPGNSRNNDQRILVEKNRGNLRRRRIEASARVPFLGALPKEEWEVHHRDHGSRTGCKLDRVAFMEEVWTVIQRKVFEDCNKKQGQEIERLRQEYKERSEQVALTTAVEKVIPARDIPRGQILRENTKTWNSFGSKDQG